MDKGSEKHLQRIKDKFTSLVDTKYRKGAKEHGGRLYEKEGILDMLIEEILDALVYVLTLKEQEDKGSTKVPKHFINYTPIGSTMSIEILPQKCLNCHEEVKALFCRLCSLCYCSLNPETFAQYAEGVTEAVGTTVVSKKYLQ